MNLKLLLAMPVLSLILGCAHSVKDDSPASDVDVLVANVKANSAKVLLPNGREYCAEESRTQQALDDCTGDLEDALLTANRRAASVVSLVVRILCVADGFCALANGGQGLRAPHPVMP